MLGSPRSRHLGSWLAASLLGCPAGAGDDEIAATEVGTHAESSSAHASEGESSGSSSSDASGSDVSSSDASSSDASTTDSSTTDASTTDASDSESTSGDELPDGCVPGAFDHAPPATLVDGLPAVPIDVLALDALIVFDVPDHSAAVEATLSFQLGPEGGMPIFDLRQAIVGATLDGQPLGSGQFGLHEFGKGLAFGFRVLEQALEPCSTHELVLTYSLGLPNAPAAGGLTWSDAPARVAFDTWMSDLNPGRYLESWLPANLPFDRHPISLGITLVGAEVEHALITNASVDELGIHDWQLEFPPSTRAMSPLIVVVPSSEITSVAGVHAAANGQDIPYVVHRHASLATPIETYEAELLAALDEFVISTGDFAHEQMTAYLGASLRSMEYAGALTTKPGDLRHEAFHSWWARGLLPATYADGWIDEAWDMYNTTQGLTFTSEPFDWAAPALLLADPHPFARDTPDEAYTQGRRLFAGLAALLGVDPLRAAMAELYLDLGPHGSLTTAALERHLYCTGGELPEVRQAFWRFVHAQAGQAPAPAQDYCG